MKPHVKQYLSKLRADQPYYRCHVVRSSPSVPRQVPFMKWAKGLKDERDVLLDFSTREPVRIHLNHHKALGPTARGWYFVDSRGRKMACCSGYEALFVAYLRWNNLPFVYQKWMFARTPTNEQPLQKRKLKEWLWNRGISLHDSRAWVNLMREENGFLYIPDFYLPTTNEFIELKGWRTSPGQIRAVRCLKRMGYRHRVLEWKDLREILGLPSSYNSCLYRAKKFGAQPKSAFANPDWVRAHLCAAPAMPYRDGTFLNSTRRAQ